MPSKLDNAPLGRSLSLIGTPATPASQTASFSTLKSRKPAQLRTTLLKARLLSSLASKTGSQIVSTEETDDTGEGLLPSDRRLNRFHSTGLLRTMLEKLERGDNNWLPLVDANVLQLKQGCDSSRSDAAHSNRHLLPHPKAHLLMIHSDILNGVVIPKLSDCDLLALTRVSRQYHNIFLPIFLKRQGVYIHNRDQRTYVSSFWKANMKALAFWRHSPSFEPPFCLSLSVEEDQYNAAYSLLSSLVMFHVPWVTLKFGFAMCEIRTANILHTVGKCTPDELTLVDCGRPQPSLRGFHSISSSPFPNLSCFAVNMDVLFTSPFAATTLAIINGPKLKELDLRLDGLTKQRWTYLLRHIHSRTLHRLEVCGSVCLTSLVMFVYRHLTLQHLKVNSYAEGNLLVKSGGVNVPPDELDELEAPPLAIQFLFDCGVGLRASTITVLKRSASPDQEDPSPLSLLVPHIARMETLTWLCLAVSGDVAKLRLSDSCRALLSFSSVESLWLYGSRFNIPIDPSTYDCLEGLITSFSKLESFRLVGWKYEDSFSLLTRLKYRFPLLELHQDITKIE